MSEKNEKKKKSLGKKKFGYKKKIWGKKKFE